MAHTVHYDFATLVRRVNSIIGQAWLHACRKACTYDLARRGFCVVTGRNEDDQGAESNGAGKSALVMAPLWALTGKSDARNEVSAPFAQQTSSSSVLWPLPLGAIFARAYANSLRGLQHHKQHLASCRHVIRVAPDTCAVTLCHLLHVAKWSAAVVPSVTHLPAL